MTDTPSKVSGDAGPRSPLERLLRLKRLFARIVLFAEAAIPRTLPIAGVILLFFSVAWLGLFRLMPVWLHVIVLLGFAGAAIFLCTRLFQVRWPAIADADRMLEERNSLPHQAISVQEDRPATDGPFGAALWQEHQKRMSRMIGGLQAGSPKPDVARHDPYALRALPVLIAVVAFAYSYSNRAGSVSEAFHWPEAVSLAPDIRIDAWVTPPGYTGRPPIFLTSRADEQVPPGSAETNAETIRIPQFSDLTVRITGGSDDETVTYATVTDEQPIVIASEEARKAEETAQAEPGAATVAIASAQGRNHLYKIVKDGTLKVGDQEWRFAVTPDKVPEIAFSGTPRGTVNAALEIGFLGTDDYGVTNAWAEILPLDETSDARPLYPMPEYRLDITRRNGGREVKGLTSRNLSEHPLSGKRVRITLVARDAAGQEGRSAPHDMILPALNFIEPLAGSVAEQRQIFALDANRLPRSVDLNDALMLRPEETIPNLIHYLLMQSVQTRMQLSRNDDMLREAADHLWEVALGMEGGDLSLAERNLRDAQEKLAEALENGASDEEIARLMEELKAAMQQFMEAMARQAMKNPQTANNNMQQRNNTIRQQDLERMMDQIENLAKSGSRDEARQLLSEMQRMMNNMMAGRPQQQQQGEQNSAAREQMDKLGQLMQDQQRLMEETFRLDQALRDRMQRGDPLQGEDSELFGQEQQPGDNGQQQGQEGQPGQDGQNPTDQMTAEQLREALKQLQAQQEALGKQLGEVQKGLEGLGIQPGKGFGDAGREMKGAAGALGQGQGEEAVGGQGRALEALRQGAQEMMQQMQAQGEGPGEGQGPGQGQGVPQYGQNGRDPLGRSRQDNGNPMADSGVEIPDEIDIQRSREIREQIRRMLGTNTSPEQERQYLERLLDIR